MEQLSPSPQLLNLCCNYWSLHALEPVLHNKRGHCSEKPVHHTKEQPLLTAARETSWAATKTQHGQKYIHKKFRKWTVLVTQSCQTLWPPWTVARQAPPSMGFSRQKYWSRLPFPSSRNHPDPGIEPRSPALQADCLPSEPPGKP